MLETRSYARSYPIKWGILSDIIYQASDLASSKRVDFIRDAKRGGARLRDKDGSSLLFLPEVQVNALRSLTRWSQLHLILSGLLDSGTALTVTNLGELAWLRVFDEADVREFCSELHVALLAALADDQSDVVEDCVAAWRITANEMSDPLRRAVLTASFSSDDYVDPSEPVENDH